VCDTEETDRVLTEFNHFVALHIADLHWSSLCEFFLSLLDHHAGEAACVDDRVANAIDDVRN
jgi:hypothetical protein